MADVDGDQRRRGAGRRFADQDGEQDRGRGGAAPRRRCLAATGTADKAVEALPTTGRPVPGPGETPMLDAFTPLDTIALAVFFIVWVVYNWLFDSRFRRSGSINAGMMAVRRAWVVRLLAREQKVMDSMLVGHTIHSAAFFASTTTILLAGMVGVLGASERIHASISGISVLLSPNQTLFEVKVLLIIGVFVYAFFKFTWAIRLLNYFCAVIGGAPDIRGASPDDERTRRMTSILDQGIWQFNAGVRAHYYTLAVLGWFLHPVAFIVTTLLVTAVLVHRQLFSPTARAIADHVACLEGAEPPPPSTVR
jgi:uncharacterized membrane protein